MSWKSTNIMQERVRFVIRASSGSEPLSRLCEEFGINRSTGLRWRKRYDSVGDINSLREYSRAPHNKPKKIPEDIENKVIKLREKYGWGARKLECLLLDEGIRVPSITISRIIKRNGLIPEKDVVGRAEQRFERGSPNELWQMDFKGDVKAGDSVCHPLSIIDDHSRYAVGLFPLENLKREGVEKSLKSAFKNHGLPDSMLMDRGTPWWNTNSVYGLTMLGVWLIEQDIKLIRGRVRHPQTQGKVERFHRTIKEAIKHRGEPKNYRHLCRVLKEFRDDYNNIRPHEALKMKPPAKLYCKSKREYQSKIKPWIYPEKSLVYKVDDLGMISVRGRRIFISEALRQKQVALEKLDDSHVVSFRNMYIRQVYPKTGRSSMLLLPVTQKYW